ncbi:hypothetical protein Pelo_2198 [Pelomyxa schiedti]|nr:hypothetical protein Pelo_2198 [Pelomyxa schiedti]
MSDTACLGTTKRKYTVVELEGKKYGVKLAETSNLATARKVIRTELEVELTGRTWLFADPNDSMRKLWEGMEAVVTLEKALSCATASLRLIVSTSRASAPPILFAKGSEKSAAKTEIDQVTIPKLISQEEFHLLRAALWKRKHITKVITGIGLPQALCPNGTAPLGTAKLTFDDDASMLKLVHENIWAVNEISTYTHAYTSLGEAVTAKHLELCTGWHVVKKVEIHIPKKFIQLSSDVNPDFDQAAKNNARCDQETWRIHFQRLRHWRFEASKKEFSMAFALAITGKKAFTGSGAIAAKGEKAGRGLDETTTNISEILDLNKKNWGVLLSNMYFPLKTCGSPEQPDPTLPSELDSAQRFTRPASGVVKNNAISDRMGITL